jgi:anhydro-N-acetylmuramic acid kinase
VSLIPILGLMSGTSMDGIDACILKTDGNKFQRTGFNLIHQYSSDTSYMLKKFNKDPQLFLTDKDLIKKLELLITIDHISCVEDIISKSKVKPIYIGFHGQTVFHDPQQKTVQLGNAQVLASETKIRVIHNFRTNDIKNGGHGAPIAPIYHKALIEDIKPKLPACFVNIGGISNITYWDGNTLIGFDVGPGNTLIDTFVKNKYNLDFDNNGKIASSGLANRSIINKFMQNNFFNLPFPKSLDKFHFNYIFRDDILSSLNNRDVVCTLTELTVQSIVVAVQQLPKKSESIIICGGGQHNKYLIDRLKESINCKVITSNEINIPGDMIEAEMIAYLSARSLKRLEFTYPTTTGVNRPCTGGEILLP